MPTADVVAPSSMFSVPPLMVIIALIEACIMKNAMAAERAATSFSFLAIPMATPIAKIIGRFANTMLPASLMTWKMAYGMVPGPMTFNSP